MKTLQKQPKNRVVKPHFCRCKNPTCNELFEQQNKQARYCSNACKQKAYRLRCERAKPKAKPTYALRCAACGETIYTHNPRALYCDAVCKQRAYRAKLASLRGGATYAYAAGY